MLLLLSVQFVVRSRYPRVSATAPLSLCVGTHDCNWSPEQFTRRDWLQGLVPRTVHTKCFEKQVAGTCPKTSNQFEFVGLFAGTKLDFAAKMPRSHDGTCSRVLLQGLVAGSSSLVCANLKCPTSIVAVVLLSRIQCSPALGWPLLRGFPI